LDNISSLAVIIRLKSVRLYFLHVQVGALLSRFLFRYSSGRFFKRALPKDFFKVFAENNLFF
jgi:hypothetical protein